MQYFLNGPIRRPDFVPRDWFYRVGLFGGLGPSFLWGLVPLGQHGIEATGNDAMATGSDVMGKRKINDRPRGLAKTIFITDLTTVRRWSRLRHQAGLPGSPSRVVTCFS